MQKNLGIDRLDYGHAWRMCNECGAKLYDFDGNQDMDRRCPYVKDDKGKCTDELKY